MTPRTRDGDTASGLRVLVVTTVHTPLDARIHHRQIRALIEAGAQVVYAAPWSATGTATTDALDGVRALDLPRAVGRRRLAALWAARRLLARRGRFADVILLHDPELVIARLLVRRPLPPVVLDVHEDLPASLADRTWIPAPLRPVATRFARRVERVAEHRCAGLLLAERGYQQRFLQSHPVVPNLPWLPEVTQPAGSHRRVVYLGRISAGRGARELLALADVLRRPADGRPPIDVELIGPVDRDVRAEVERAHARGTAIWHGFLPNDRALQRLAGSLGGLSPLHDLPNYRVSMPTKVLEYLAVGLPAITTPLPEAVALIDRSDAGRVVDFGDVDAMARAVLDLDADRAELRRLSDNGRTFVREHLSWEAHADAFVARLTELAGRP